MDCATLYRLMNAPSKLILYRMLLENRAITIQDLDMITQLRGQALAQQNYFTVECYSRFLTVLRNHLNRGPGFAVFGWRENSELQLDLHPDVEAELWQSPISVDFQQAASAILKPEQIIGLLESTSNSYLKAELATRLGEWYLRSSSLTHAQRNEIAIKYFLAALEFFTPETFPLDCATCHCGLGVAYETRVNEDFRLNLERAREHYRICLSLINEHENPDDFARTHSNLSALFGDCLIEFEPNSYFQALAHMTISLRIWVPTVYPIHYAKALNNLATTLWNSPGPNRAADLEKAIQHLRDSLRIWNRDRHPIEWAMIMKNLGISFGARMQGDVRGNLAQAKDYFMAAMTVWTEQDHPYYYSAAQQKLAETYTKHLAACGPTELEDGIACCLASMRVRTLDKYPQRRFESLLTLATLRFARKEWEEVIKVVNQIKEVEAFWIARHLSHPVRNNLLSATAPWYGRSALAAAYLGDFSLALTSVEYSRARILKESLYRNHFLYEMLPAELKQRYEVIIQRLKEVENQQAMATQQGPEFIRLMEEFARDRSKLETLLAEITQQQPNLGEPVVSYPEICKCLSHDQKTAFIVIEITPNGTLTLMLTGSPTHPHEVAVTSLGLTSDGISALGERWWRLHSDFDRVQDEIVAKLPSDPETCRRLNDQMIRDFTAGMTAIITQLDRDFFHMVEEQLRTLTVDRLIFLPHPSLQVFPLHLLPSFKSGTCRYLSEDYDVRYAPSFRKLDVHQPTLPLQGLLGVASSRGDLPQSWSEINEIARLFSEATVLKGSQATLGELRQHLSRCSVLHIASHSVWNPVDPRQSGICLALADPLPDVDFTITDPHSYRTYRSLNGSLLALVHDYDEESRVYTVYGAHGVVKDCLIEKSRTKLYRSDPHDQDIGELSEEVLTIATIIRDFDLRRVWLVVLTGCRTGLSASEEIPTESFGLPWAFLAAGAKVVLASLWPVHDESTKMLISRFYRSLIYSNLDVAAALRAAQEWLRTETRYRSPFFWAGFYLWGS